MDPLHENYEGNFRNSCKHGLSRLLLFHKYYTSKIITSGSSLSLRDSQVIFLINERGKMGSRSLPNFGRQYKTLKELTKTIVETMGFTNIEVSNIIEMYP